MYCTENREKVKIVGNFFTSGAICIFIERMYTVDLKVGLKVIVVAVEVKR